MKKIIKILKFIVTHPIGKKRKVKALFRFLNWQVSSRLNIAKAFFDFIDNTKLFIVAKQTVSTGNYYVGLLEFKEMTFTIHFLNKNDVFFDVGTNIGTYSIIAAGVSKATVFSFEPIPETYSSLLKNIKLNKLEKQVTALNIGLSDKSGVAMFTSDLDANNHIILDSNKENTISIEVKTLNDFEKHRPSLIKVDVEGYEKFILEGGDKILVQDNLKAIIIEVNNEGDKYDIDKYSVHKKLIFYGYEAYEYVPFERKLIKTTKFKSDNRIYIKDFSFVSEKVKASDCFSVWGIDV